MNTYVGEITVYIVKDLDDKKPCETYVRFFRNHPEMMDTCLEKARKSLRYNGKVDIRVYRDSKEWWVRKTSPGPVDEDLCQYINMYMRIHFPDYFRKKPARGMGQ